MLGKRDLYNYLNLRGSDCNYSNLKRERDINIVISQVSLPLPLLIKYIKKAPIHHFLTNPFGSSIIHTFCFPYHITEYIKAEKGNKR